MINTFIICSIPNILRLEHGETQSFSLYLFSSVVEALQCDDGHTDHATCWWQDLPLQSHHQTDNRQHRAAHQCGGIADGQTGISTFFRIKSLHWRSMSSSTITPSWHWLPILVATLVSLLELRSSAFSKRELKWCRSLINWSPCWHSRNKSVYFEIMWSPAPPRPTAQVVVVMTRHGSLYPLLLLLTVQVGGLTGHIPVTRHVAHSYILHIGVHLRVKSFN